MSLVQMNTCVFNSFNDDQLEFTLKLLDYAKIVISFVVSTLTQPQLSKVRK